MIDLLKKEELSKEELEKLDYYFDSNKIEELLELDNKTIIRFIESSEEILGYSLAKIELDNYLFGISLDARYDFDINKLDYYNKIAELICHFSFFNCILYYFIGDYYYENDKEESLKYYRKVFKNGFDLCDNNYYISLKNYLRLLDKNPSQELKELIKFSPRDNKYSLDFIDTYLLLIINLEKYSDEYLKYINEAIIIALKVVREYQEQNKNRSSFSDTEEERDLCELIALKMEYYVKFKDYIKAYEAYKQLTYEIGRSDCIRYYHARDKFYRQMLEDMSVEYPELKFFNNIGYSKFKILGEYQNFEVNQEIILEKSNGLTFKFKIIDIYQNQFIIIPILPLLKDGGRMFVDLINENGVMYLINRLSN